MSTQRLRTCPYLEIVFADVISYDEVVLDYGGPKSNDWCPYKRRGHTEEGQVRAVNTCSFICSLVRGRSNSTLGADPGLPASTVQGAP